MIALLILASASIISGCFSIERGHLRHSGNDHILVGNYGWYLFHCIPVACGNASENPWVPFVTFRDDVTMDKLQSRFMGETKQFAAESGRRLEDVKIHDLAYSTSESVMLNIPGFQIPLPIPYLLTYREVQLSGVVE